MQSIKEPNKLYSLMANKSSQPQFIFKVCNQTPKIELLSCVPADQFNVSDSENPLETSIFTATNLLDSSNGIQIKKLKLSKEEQTPSLLASFSNGNFL